MAPDFHLLRQQKKYSSNENQFLLSLGAALAPVAAFQSNSLRTTRESSVVVFEYVPSGFTKESWAKYKAEEAKKKKKNLGRMVRSFSFPLIFL